MLMVCSWILCRMVVRSSDATLGKVVVMVHKAVVIIELVKVMVRVRVVAVVLVVGIGLGTALSWMMGSCRGATGDTGLASGIMAGLKVALTGDATVVSCTRGNKAVCHWFVTLSVQQLFSTCQCHHSIAMIACAAGTAWQ